MAMLCAAVLALTSAPGARAMTQVKIAGTYPPGDTITLGRNQNFYLHLAYTSDRPVQIWAQPYFEGQPAKAGSNPSRRYPAGSGEAMGWFFLFDPGTRVDEVRIRAGDGTPDGTPVVATYALSLTGGDEAGEESPPPAWVSTLGAADRAAQRADYERRMNTPLHTSDIAIVGGFMLAMYSLGLIGFAAPAWGLWRWRGGWRLAAAIPMAMMVFVVLRLFIDTARDRTSHNLWPFEILLWGAASVGWMLLLVLARKLVGAKRA
ncbi:MAG TPA: hypothetical protein VN043_15340 [Rhodanobacter sp.]|nr:hypothetical protein [Rhodanobacter sp.]